MKILSTVGLVGLATTVFSQTPDWDAKLKEVSSYDNNTNCLTYDDGTWKKPKKDVLKALAAMKTNIQDVARRMGVDPRAVAGAILAENSMNVSVSDGVQDFLVKHGIAKNGSILGKKFTFGWGQLHIDTAREGERLAAKLENRKQISDDELGDALLIPEKAMYYVAAVIRKVQDDYKAQGIDISGKPAILATLYNLGKSETKAREAKASGRAPRENFFGLFIDRYLEDIEGAVGKPSTAGSPPAPIAKAPAKPAPKTVEKPTVAAVAKPKKFQTVLTGDLPVYQAPPACRDSQNDMSGLIDRYQSYSYSKVTSVMKASATIKEVIPAIDCEANAWVLVRSGDQMGWVSRKDFDAKSEKKLAEVQECKSKTDPQCKAAVQAATKELWSEEKPDPKSETLFVSPISASGKGHFKQMDQRCRVESRERSATVQKVVSWMSTHGYDLNQKSIQNDPKEELAEIDAVEKVLDAKLTEIDQTFKLKGDFNSPSNPYQLISSLSVVKEHIKNCRTQVQAGLTCSVLMKRLIVPIQSIVVKESPSFHELRIHENILHGNITAGWSPKFFVVTQSEYKTKNQFILGMNDCLSRLDTFAQTFVADRDYTRSSGQNMQYPINKIKLLMNSVMAVSENEIQKVIPTLTRYEKACRAFASLVNSKEDAEANKKTTSSCETFPLGGMGVFKSISSSLARKMMVTDEDLASSTLDEILESIIPSYMIQGKAGMGGRYDNVMKGAYCPNKTAEFIEELLKKNKCIQMIHMPSRWIVNRLNEYSDRVIFRPYEDEDRYGIEFVGGCTK